MLVVLILGAVLLFAMVCVSWHGAKTLPNDARIPLGFGITWKNFVSKRVGLIMHPAIGAGAFTFITIMNSNQSEHGSSSNAPPEMIIPLVMCVLLVAQVGAIRVARGKSGIQR